MKKIIFFLLTIVLCVCALLLLNSAGSGQKKKYYSQKTFIFGVPAQVKVYGSTKAQGKMIADAVFNEWGRISDEFNYEDPYSITSTINKKGTKEWVKTDSEFINLIKIAMDYTRMTNGAFDITFAPLWPLWRDAAASKKLPAQEDIDKALKMIGSDSIEVNVLFRSVHLKKPVSINLGGLLRGYCFEKAYQILQHAAISFPVELHLGQNMMVYGGKGWQYKLKNPITGKEIGSFIFDKGAVISSSGRDGFVEIEGQKYSHLLDLTTGYPIKNFSSLTVYFPDFGNDNYLSTAALAVMGKTKAFAALENIKGSAAVWIDDMGEPSYLFNDSSQASWNKNKGLLDYIGLSKK